MYTLTISRYSANTGGYHLYANATATEEDVALITAHFVEKPVIQGFYQLTISGPARQATYYTVHPDILGYLKAAHKKA